ncbi:hypothetical protein EMIHUDRAFT_234082 [Emiliania huxleyi CCMP1516]|uniref:Nuf2 DHR10-like domain-containing protein n=2 Tax=Emiliania huxleyi TaxID=2903 RepID=A0A0D3K060_EMIH1|nr:hypothetical protein EMIHUDRAFT_234082 [Emiliania huxleyi CCMP1516]EOD29145.1 hypothetical protein EMIHUDRAFT_234082 [Emiliania huxleyi CCMP1516]|eukprot:XP_005781574.1 hypothetical protein EMIHUDRAFT_234082 [Emiliania huxleyi CCMP1516]
MDTRSLALTAVTGGTRRTGTTGVGSTTGRLNAIADGVNVFYGDLEEETKIRKQAEEKRVARMERELGKVETVIAAETRRRIEASKALQVMFESQLEKLQAQIDALVARVETIEATLVEEKRDRELAVQRANRDVVDNFAEHVKQFDVEKVVRLQREAQTLKRVGDEVYRVQQKAATVGSVHNQAAACVSLATEAAQVTAERTAREAAIVLMKDDFAAALEVRDKADEVFKAEARLASEEQLVAALNDYTTALQDGLKIFVDIVVTFV